jgi:dinuclear metal center YbgI/SA1388 family protein
MTVALTDLVKFLADCLQPDRFDDYCPNGLQVEGRPRVKRLVTGVTASQRLLDAAVACEADAILVHHGYFWRGEDAVVVGMKRRRLATLLRHDISLLAYHLPLDAHPELGNNACLGRLLGFPAGDPLQPALAGSVGNIVNLPSAVTAGDLVAKLEEVTGRTPLHIGQPSRTVRRVAWCTGAAQSYLEWAAQGRADMYITGEVSEQTVHIAREREIDFVAAGHHATERYGVQALGEHVAAKLGLEHLYVDDDNPV